MMVAGHWERENKELVFNGFINRDASVSHSKEWMLIMEMEGVRGVLRKGPTNEVIFKLKHE